MGRITNVLIVTALAAFIMSCGGSGNETSKTASTTALSSSLDPSGVGQAVMFTAVVKGPSGTPTGTVAFEINGANPTAVSLSSGQAVFSSTPESLGSVTVTANYSGDNTYAPSASSAFTQTVNPDTVIIGGSPKQPLTQNGAGDYVAQVTVTNSGNVTISSVQVTIAGTTLGSGSLLSAPAVVANLAPAASAVVTLTFPADSVPAGATTAQLTVGGTYSAPSLSLTGNWGLSFRSVSL